MVKYPAEWVWGKIESDAGIMGNIAGLIEYVRDVTDWDILYLYCTYLPHHNEIPGHIKPHITSFLKATHVNIMRGNWMHTDECVYCPRLLTWLASVVVEYQSGPLSMWSVALTASGLSGVRIDLKWMIGSLCCHNVNESKFVRNEWSNCF